MHSTQEEIVQLVHSLGGTFTGFSNVSGKVPEVLSKYPFAVTIGIRLADAIIDEIEDKPTFTYFNHYRSVNALIDQINLRVLLLLQSKGHNAYTIPASQSIPNAEVPYSGMFPHKTAAVLAGLGWIGKNGLFISKDYGPRVRLGTILTDAELECSGEKSKNLCGECNRCVESCPAMALRGERWEEGCDRDRVVDAKACSEYMNQKFKHIGRGSVCGICVKVCPYGGQKK
ncbi:MAG: epoxyqueuosine reductase [Clostridia bacterium]|nr:epoxyqueuosine reductase [Clostridia bacterium]